MAAKHLPTPEEVLAGLGPWEEYDRTHCRDEAPFRAFFEHPERMTVFTRKIKKSAYGVGEQWTIKHCRYLAMPAPKSRYWEKEDRVLARLGGLRAPRSKGYILRVTEDGLDALLCREFLAGEPLGAVGEGDMEPFVDFFVDIHRAGVTTEDPNAGNFVRTGAGLVFIDYEWSRAHDSFWSLHFKIGKELANVRRYHFADDDARYDDFCKRYFTKAKPNALGTLLIGLGYRWWRFKKRFLSSGKGDIR